MTCRSKSTFDADLDEHRLDCLRERVFTLMRDGKWRTLSEIRAVTAGEITGVSAKLRDLRKLQYGSHDVQRRRRGDPKSGNWEYRLIMRTETSEPVQLVFV